MSPCPTCPWLRSSTVGGADIANFSLEKMRNLRNTVGDGDGFRKVMACHHSVIDAEYACAGYLFVEGWSNIEVRLLHVQGRIDIVAVREACADLDLWPDFETMLATYEAAASSGRTIRCRRLSVR